MRPNFALALVRIREELNFALLPLLPVRIREELSEISG